MAKGDDIEDRLIAFAVRVIRVCDSLPDTPAGRHAREQLLRCGTAPAPNYSEARAAESGKDFVHKLKVVLKELNEARVWLEIIMQADMLPGQRLHDLLDECDQLCRIMSKSIHTARKNDRN